MKVLRVGRLGAEKPVIDYEGELRDVSVYVSEVDRTFLKADWHRSLQGLERETMPWVNAAARRGACVEQAGRMIWTGPLTQPVSAGEPLNVRLRGGRLFGASDPIVLPPVRAEFGFNGGLAAVLRERQGTVTISGVSLYLDIRARGGQTLHEGACDVASSADTLFSLGPHLIDPEDWSRHRSGSAEARHNDRIVATCTNEVDVDALRDRFAGIEALCRLTTGDIVLVEMFSAMATVALAVGDTVRIAAPGLGEQERICVASRGREAN
jgi:hypothetical protein